MRYARPLAEDTANAQRIVACVNALAGIADPETTIPALIAALRECVEWREGDPDGLPFSARLRAVLAQVPKGEPS